MALVADNPECKSLNGNHRHSSPRAFFGLENAVHSVYGGHLSCKLQPVTRGLTDPFFHLLAYLDNAFRSFSVWKLFLVKTKFSGSFLRAVSSICDEGLTVTLKFNDWTEELKNWTFLDVETEELIRFAVTENQKWLFDCFQREKCCFWRVWTSKFAMARWQRAYGNGFIRSSFEKLRSALKQLCTILVPASSSQKRWTRARFLKIVWKEFLLFLFFWELYIKRASKIDLPSESGFLLHEVRGTG